MTKAFGPQICKAKKRPEPKALGRLNLGNVNELKVTLHLSYLDSAHSHF